MNANELLVVARLYLYVIQSHWYGLGGLSAA